MQIQFHPEPRMVLMCDFATGFKEPEMTKLRPVVVMSPQRHNRETCIVVPLSTVEPEPILGFHHRLDSLSLPLRLRKKVNWVKGDMVTAVGLWRLDRVMNGRDANGKRLYVAHSVTLADWVHIQRAVAASLGWGNRLMD
jgi:uncharacterized protein YifN (PemK superfamily)